MTWDLLLIFSIYTDSIIAKLFPVLSSQRKLSSATVVILKLLPRLALTSKCTSNRGLAVTRGLASEYSEVSCPIERYRKYVLLYNWVLTFIKFSSNVYQIKG